MPPSSPLPSNLGMHSAITCKCMAAQWVGVAGPGQLGCVVGGWGETGWLGETGSQRGRWGPPHPRALHHPMHWLVETAIVWVRGMLNVAGPALKGLKGLKG